MDILNCPGYFLLKDYGNSFKNCLYAEPELFVLFQGRRRTGLKVKTVEIWRYLLEDANKRVFERCVACSWILCVDLFFFFYVDVHLVRDFFTIAIYLLFCESSIGNTCVYLYVGEFLNLCQLISLVLVCQTYRSWITKPWQLLKSGSISSLMKWFKKLKIPQCLGYALTINWYSRNR